MKTKYFTNVSLLFFLFFAIYTHVFTQSTGTTLKGGITIAMKVEVTPSDGAERYPISSYGTYSTTTDNRHIEHRVLVDRQNKMYFGYDLEVFPDTPNRQFKLYVRPLSLNQAGIQRLFSPPKYPSKEVAKFIDDFKAKHNFPPDNLDVKNLSAISLPKYPNEIIIGDDDLVTLDILENPQTKAKITDLIRVTAKSKHLALGELFEEKTTPKDFSLKNVQLQLLRFQIQIDDKKIAEFDGGAIGSFLAFYIKDKGLFIFSLSPVEGYDFKKIGIIEENKISFTIGGEKYKFTALSPILSQGGNWNLWVWHNPSYVPSEYSTMNGKDIGFYGTDYIQYIYPDARGKVIRN